MPAKKPNTRPLMIWLVVSWIIILVWIWIVFFRNNPRNVAVDTPIEQEETQKWYIGENILSEWTLTPVDGFGMYTHTFVSINGETFGAKSSILDLSEFNWNVELKWTINEFKKEIPVISVTEIVPGTWSAWWTAANTTTLEWNPSLFYDLNNWLAIDLSISEGYDVEKTNNGLTVVDRNNNNEEVLFVEAFTCKQWDPLQDCAVLKDRFVTFNNDSFTNAQWVTFYNLTETNTWFAFNGDKQWYSIRANDANKITTFASLIDFVSEDELDQFVIQNKQLCKSLSSELAVVSKVVYTDKGNWLFDAAITGKTENDVIVACDALVKVWSPLKIEIVSYNDGSVEIVEEEVVVEDETENDTDIDTETDNEELIEDTPEEIVEEKEREEIAPGSTQTQKPASFNWWLQYSSIRWFVMWFSKQWVSYWGEVLPAAETFWQDGVSCWYKVNVIEWKRAEFVSTEPDLVVYECTWISANALPSWSQLVGTAWWKQFIAKRYTTNLWSMEIFVEDKPAEELSATE